MANLNDKIASIREILAEVDLSEEDSFQVQQILSFNPKLTEQSIEVLRKNLQKLEFIVVKYI